MNPAEEAERIVTACVPDGVKVLDRAMLSDEIRSAILRARIEALQPPELLPQHACTIPYQILFFVDHYIHRLRGADYVEQANALRECRRRVLKLAKIKDQHISAKGNSKAMAAVASRREST